LDDRNNANGYYCKITYAVQDADGGLSNSKTITISLNPIDQQPRPDPPTTYEQAITILESSNVNLNLTGRDPEGDTIYLLTLSCTQPTNGVFTIGSSPVNCSGQQLWASANGQFLVNFAPTPGQNGYDYNELRYTYLDYVPGSLPINVATLDTYIYQIDVLAKNDAPAHSIFGSFYSTPNTYVQNPKVVQLGVNSATRGLLLQLNVTDPDLVDPGVQGNLTVNVSLSFNQNLATVTLEINPSDILVDVLVNTQAQKIFVGPQGPMKATLARLAIKYTGATTFRVEVNVTDNGYVGVCDTTLQPCALWTASRTDFRASPGGGSNALVVGVAAAGAVAVAGIAGVAGWKRYNRPRDGYEPWKEIAMPDVGAVSNPMYETGRLSGTNPFYVDPSSTQ